MTFQHPTPMALWLVSAVLVVAAIIDGWKLKVPNWLTYPFAFSGLAVSALPGGIGPWESLLGLAVGLALLLPLYAIGGMGAGDVKLLAGVGAWVGPAVTLGAFVATALAGGAIALVMMLASGEFLRHWIRMREIGREIVEVRDPVRLSEIAAARKPVMRLLPYGIPIAVGSIAYFTWTGLLFGA
jgi:prepilin peptidase CpaA